MVKAKKKKPRRAANPPAGGKEITINTKSVKVIAAPGGKVKIVHYGPGCTW